MTNPRYAPHDPRFAQFVDLDQAPRIISSGHIWAEGPVWAGTHLYFNDVPSKRMWRWNETDGSIVALQNSEFANGNTTDLDGYMISCEHGGRRVVRRLDPTDPDSVQVLAENFDGKRLNSPNDVVVASDGSVWFTDPPYGINSDVEGYPAESEIGGNYVFRLSPDGALTAVATDFDKPNGLAFSPDESLLYIADSGAIKGASFPGFDYKLPHHIRVFDVKDGTLTNSRIFAVIEPGVPDGFRVDTEGYVWTSALDGIRCLDRAGELIGKILLPEPTSNCCFGGPDGTDLFITSSSHVYRVKTTRRGAESLRSKAK
ncbi:SMP-30/gluconolactonase/LRE family protein [Roseibium sp. CAU 1637]|uniref:SMP-30/gluconolactonase/LRE family protein n=1 Tax=Roseibium limicola TaxID=2816037 RepID=A0A939ESH9_9HYPH|nr:SMP-30/gluconolactonase/LRE family protein [Roseibium limicola]MBO0346309.1 SMP-30/gluconolactonase/LRE family protein [Roseibium limicola]